MKTTLTLITALLLAPLAATCAPKPSGDADQYLKIVRAYADCMIERGRDTYGKEHSALFAEALVFAELSAPCRGCGAFTLLHICGDNTLILDDLAATGVDVFKIDHKMDLGLCKQRIGEKVCLIGNLDPTQTILHGTANDVRRESRRCLEQAGRGGGFILGTGCFVPWDSPLENLRAMVETGRQEQTR